MFNDNNVLFDEDEYEFAVTCWRISAKGSFLCFFWGGKDEVIESVGLINIC